MQDDINQESESIQAKPINKGGRPRREFTEKDWQLLENCCRIHCTGEEVASVIGVDYDTLNARIKERYDCGFSDYIKTHADIGRASLRRMQFKIAEQGNPTMLIWLGKQYLDKA
jgi:hypothetical protein